MADTPRRRLSSAAIERGMCRLDERIADLTAIDLQIDSEDGSELLAISVAIKDTLERCFGIDTAAYDRFKSAVNLQPDLQPSVDDQAEPVNFREAARLNIEKSLVLIREARRVLKEDRFDAADEAGFSSQPSVPVPASLTRRVFVVHGHDDGAKETLARFLERIGFEAIILHEQANKSRTIIEKIEAFGDVGFAVVLLTPDDEGNVKGAPPKSRARQNVLLELGYFIGRLGRDKVCVIMRGDVEMPSDVLGIAWVAMDSAGAWKQALGSELEAAGHELDWNKLMKT